MALVDGAKKWGQTALSTGVKGKLFFAKAPAPPSGLACSETTTLS
jgi:hypothetical protein